MVASLIVVGQRDIVTGDLWNIVGFLFLLARLDAILPQQRKNVILSPFDGIRASHPSPNGDWDEAAGGLQHRMAHAVSGWVVGSTVAVVSGYR